MPVDDGYNSGDPRHNDDLVGDVATLKEAMRRMDQKVDSGFDRYDGRFDNQDEKMDRQGEKLDAIHADLAGLRQMWSERTGFEKGVAAIIGVLVTAVGAVFGPQIVSWIAGLFGHSTGHS